jgi:hypothetical protein
MVLMDPFIAGEVPWSSSLFHDAIRGGREITREEYERG